MPKNDLPVEWGTLKLSNTNVWGDIQDSGNYPKRYLWVEQIPVKLAVWAYQLFGGISYLWSLETPLALENRMFEWLEIQGSWLIPSFHLIGHQCFWEFPSFKDCDSHVIILLGGCGSPIWVGFRDPSRMKRKKWKEKPKRKRMKKTRIRLLWLTWIRGCDQSMRFCTHFLRESSSSTDMVRGRCSAYSKHWMYCWLIAVHRQPKTKKVGMLTPILNLVGWWWLMKKIWQMHQKWQAL